MKKLAFVGLAVLVAGQASAHPDHVASPAAGLAHLVTDPFHLAWIGIAGLAATLVGTRVRRRLARRI